MTFTVMPTADRGTFLFDDKTKSTFSKPRAIPVDLTGCNSPTHISAGIASTLNFRDGCADVAPAMSFSLSTKTLSDTLADPVATRGDQLVLSIADLVFNAGVFDITAFDLSATGNVPFEFDGNTYISDGSSSGMNSLTVSHPTSSMIYDPCGGLAGYKASISTTEYEFDTTTCSPRLLESISLKVSIILVYKGQTIPWGVTSNTSRAAAIYNQSKHAWLQSFNPGSSSTPLVDNYTAQFLSEYPLFVPLDIGT
jgi:hypothetical protein